MRVNHAIQWKCSPSIGGRLTLSGHGSGSSISADGSVQYLPRSGTRRLDRLLRYQEGPDPHTDPTMTRSGRELSARRTPPALCPWRGTIPSHSDIYCQSTAVNTQSVLFYSCRCRSPPMGGLLAMDKPMTLPAHEYRNKFCGPKRRRLPIVPGGSVVARGADARST
jgi:hypothetical protein